MPYQGSSYLGGKSIAPFWVGDTEYRYGTVVLSRHCRVGTRHLLMIHSHLLRKIMTTAFEMPRATSEEKIFKNKDLRDLGSLI